MFRPFRAAILSLDYPGRCPGLSCLRLSASTSESGLNGLCENSTTEPEAAVAATELRQSVAHGASRGSSDRTRPTPEGRQKPCPTAMKARPPCRRAAARLRLARCPRLTPWATLFRNSVASPWEFRGIPGIRRKIPGFFRTVPGNHWTKGGILPTVPDRRLANPDRRQNSTRTPWAAPRILPTILGNRGMVVANSPANPRHRQTNPGGASQFPGGM